MGTTKRAGRVVTKQPIKRNSDTPNMALARWTDEYELVATSGVGSRSALQLEPMFRFVRPPHLSADEPPVLEHVAGARVELWYADHVTNQSGILLVRGEAARRLFAEEVARMDGDREKPIRLRITMELLPDV